MKAITKAQRSSQQDWLDVGVGLLRADGDQGLTVDALCTRMGRTKGSFYHHFADRDDFVARLLGHWERTFTLQIIADLEPVSDPLERLRVLGDRTAHEVDLRLERTIRIWSDHEPAARTVLDRVDQARERYLERLFSAAFGDSKRATLAARAHMAVLVGTQMLYQDLSREDLRALNNFTETMGFGPRLTTEEAISR